jgi:hypothetical protein
MGEESAVTRARRAVKRKKDAALEDLKRRIEKQLPREERD